MNSTESRMLTWVIGGVVLALAILGLITYAGKAETAEAQQKAQELTQKLEAAGLRAPADQDVFVRSFGSDGGNVCDNPGNALGRATLFSLFTNGASHVGQRPVIVDRRLIEGQLLIMETYCPDKLEDFREEVEDLEFDDVIKN
jgi:Tfp pilus assembly protein PilN